MLSLVVYLTFTFNYIFDYFYYPYSPYYSFYYHTAYCCMGAWLARSSQTLLILERKSLYLAFGCLLLLLFFCFEFVRPLVRLLSILLIFPCFSKLTDGQDLKDLRNKSTIIYMSQFIVIFYYERLCEASVFLSFSPVRFLFVSAICFATASACVSFENRIPVLKYLR